MIKRLAQAMLSTTLCGRQWCLKRLAA